MAAAKPKFQLGQYFTVPLSDGTFAHGYFTEVANGQMYLTTIHDLVTSTPDLPADIEAAGIAIPNLRIGGSEFRRMKPHEEQILGKSWIKTKKIHSGTIEPGERYFIMGANSNPRVWDVLRKDEMRPASEAERATLKPVGFDFPPGTRKTIEKALSSISRQVH
ncbi:hypothetical protein [Paracoccus pacificus]|uniref:Uncharacterized protein n=1 Tax=Paracoccus pacificus TaxID=1463598 RepID=A0ABW4R623_9RHOB